MTEKPKISLRLTAKSTWDFNSVGAELELSDSVRADETEDETLARIEGWVEGNLERIFEHFKTEVSESYAGHRKRNR